SDDPGFRQSRQAGKGRGSRRLDVDPLGLREEPPLIEDVLVVDRDGRSPGQPDRLKDLSITRRTLDLDSTGDGLSAGNRGNSIQLLLVRRDQGSAAAALNGVNARAATGPLF